MEEDEDVKLYFLLDEADKPSKILYNRFVEDKHLKPIDNIVKWEQDIGKAIGHNEWFNRIASIGLFYISTRMRSLLYKYYIRTVQYGTTLSKI